MVMLRDGGRYDEALAVLRRAVADHPDDHEARHNLGMFLAGLCRLDEAEREMRVAQSIAPGVPEIEYVLATTLLAQGKLREGWAFYEARLAVPSSRIPVPKGFPFPRWQGQDPAGKTIAIFPEQGFGDQIQFARFAPLLRDRGADVTLLTRPALVRLFQDSLDGVRIVAAEGAVEFPDPDFWAMSLDVARICDVTVETLSGEPYLRAARCWPVFPSGFTIGVQTRGNPNFAHNVRRSLTAAAADRLCSLLPGRVISLDPAESGAADFADTAALMRQLDLVVTTDTSVAHLAGALGKRCLVLLHGFGVDWRWMCGRADTPWYSSMTLYRAGFDDDWMPVVERAARDAAVLAAEAC